MFSLRSLNFASTKTSRPLPHRGNPQRAPLTPKRLEVSLLFNTSLINFVQTEEAVGVEGMRQVILKNHPASNFVC